MMRNLRNGMWYCKRGIRKGTKNDKGRKETYSLFFKVSIVLFFWKKGTNMQKGSSMCLVNVPYSFVPGNCT